MTVVIVASRNLPSSSEGDVTIEAGTNLGAGGGGADPETQWTNGDADNLWVNPLNWTNGVPSSTKGAVMGGASNDDCTTPDAGADVAFLDLTGYTGNICDVATGQDVWFNAYGDVTLNTGIANTRRIFIDVKDTMTLVTNGFPDVQVQHFVADKTLTFGDSARLRALTATSSGPIAFGPHVMWITDDYSDGFYFDDVVSISWEAGAKLKFSAAAAQYLDCDNGLLLPPVEIPAATSASVVVGTARVSAWSQASGSLQSNGARELTVDDNFTATGGVIDPDAATDFIIGGNFSITDCDATNMVAAVTGTAEAHDCVITDCDFSGGTELDATDGCTDGGGNTNVAFPVPAAGTPWTGRTGANASTNWFSVCHNGAGRLCAVGGYNGTDEVMTSDDNGVTWTQRTAAAAANYWSGVCWSGTNFVAVSTTGKVMTSPTGETWTERTPATAAAFRAVASDGAGIVVIAAADGTATLRVQYSAHHGVTWANKNPGATSAWNAIGYGNGYWVIGSDDGAIRRSTDATTWSACTNGSGSPTVHGLAYNGTSTWILCGTTGGSAQGAYSTDDGATWTSFSVPTDKPWKAACWGQIAGGGKFVIVGTIAAAYSTDGITWTNATPVSGASQEWRGVTHDGTNYVAVAYETTAIDVMTAP